MAEIDQKYMEEFITLRNRITEKLEQRRISRWPLTFISRLLHPFWFGLQIFDDGKLLTEGTMYTKGNYYLRYVEGIEPFCKLIFTLEKKSLDEFLARGEEIVANPIKMNIMTKKSGLKLNLGRK